MSHLLGDLHTHLTLFPRLCLVLICLSEAHMFTHYILLTHIIKNMRLSYSEGPGGRIMGAQEA